MIANGVIRCRLPRIRLDGELITRKLLGLASRSLWGTRSRTLGRRW